MILRTDTGQLSSSNGSVLRNQTLLGPLASINVSNNAVINTARDFIQQGAGVNVGKDLQVNTGGDWLLNTVEQKQSGLTLALSGTVGSAANTAVTTAKAASEESNGRLAALQGVKAALSGVQAVQGEQLAAVNASDQNAIGVSLSYGSQSSKSEQTVNQTTHQGSTLTAGNNLNITATGNGVKGVDGDIVVQGSQLQAGKDTSLTANRDVILQSTQESQTLDGSNKSSGGSLGIGIGAGQGGWGINISASLNKGKGSESGNGVTHTETTINAGNQLNITSGRDAVLQGAQVSGETVKVDVGRDLLLQSQQDSDRYDSKQQDASVGGSFNFGSMTGSASINASRDKMHSNFDSVQEQTGIFAGSGGFDITVGEHTQLDGAVIGSTATADKNTLDTGTLGFSDIENKADFKAEHQGGSLSTGGPVGSDLLSNLGGVVLSGLGNDGHAEGTTQAAVSEGNITIRDTDKQQQNVDDLSRDTDNANGSIGPIFDKEKEQNRLKEAQLIGEIGGQAMDIARTQGKIIATNAANEKMKDVKPEDIAAAEKQWAKANPGQVPTAEDINQQIYQTAYNQAFNESGLGTGGAVQRAMQAATAAVQGLAGGNMAAALANGAAPYITKLIADTLPDDPVSRTLAHAAVNAALAAAQGNNALVGAGGAVTGELIGMIAINAYGKPVSELSETEKQTVSALATLAAGLAGGLIGDSTADTVAGAQTGKTVVENNFLSVTQLDNFAQKARTCEGAACQQVIQDMVDTNLKQQKEMLEFCSSQPDQCANKYGYLVDQWDVFDKAIKQLDADGKLPNEFKNYLSAVYSSSMEAEGTVANLGWQQKFEALGLDKDTAAAMAATVPALIAAKGPKGSPLPTPNSTPAANGLNYQSNPKHTPGQQGYSFKAGTEPKNSMDLFGSSVVSGKKRYAKDAEGNVHQFTNTNDGTWHWSGSTGDKSAPLNKNTIPSDVKKQLDLPKKGW